MRLDASRTFTRREFVAAAAGVAGLSVYGTSSNLLDVSSPVLARPGNRRVRVALLTDMHGPHNYVDQDELVRAVSAFRPHLVCICGDAVDTRGDEPLVARYAALPALLGKFATLGNWEYQGECDLGRLRREYERAGVRLLINERLRLEAPDGPIDLVGLDDWRAGTPDYSQVAGIPAAAPDAPRPIVMSHCPVGFDIVSTIAKRPTAVLSGHTHGGQIAPFGVALVLPEGSGRYVRGSYASADRRHALYVSRGMGNSGPPFRIGSRPELALLTIA